ncbi:MAG: ComEA family DNA-binding protein [Nitrospiraceae bacterium]|nr:MAG: ComEA family DNA-binding protein [Nitrospiraceae bacterium]
MLIAVFLFTGTLFAAGEKTAVNINQATVKELSALPGLGKKKAEAIISYREQNGKFKSADEVKKVKGIGEDIFARIKDLIVIE